MKTKQIGGYEVVSECRDETMKTGLDKLLLYPLYTTHICSKCLFDLLPYSYSGT